MERAWSRLIRDENGFTIVEIVIAGAIAIILGLALSTLVVDMTRQRKAAEDKSDIFGAVQQLSYDLRFRQP